MKSWTSELGLNDQIIWYSNNIVLHFYGHVDEGLRFDG